MATTLSTLIARSAAADELAGTGVQFAEIGATEIVEGMNLRVVRQGGRIVRYHTVLGVRRIDDRVIVQYVHLGNEGESSYRQDVRVVIIAN